MLMSQYTNIKVNNCLQKITTFQPVEMMQTQAH